MDLPEELRSCPLFYELYDKEIAFIVRYASVIHADPGEPIVRDGDEGDEIFVMLEGNASVQKNIGGQVTKFTELHKGDLFGEMILLDDRKRSADIIAMDPCDILLLHYDDFMVIYKNNPKVFGLMALNLARLLAKRLRTTNTK